MSDMLRAVADSIHAETLRAANLYGYEQTPWEPRPGKLIHWKPSRASKVEGFGINTSEHSVDVNTCAFLPDLYSVAACFPRIYDSCPSYCKSIPKLVVSFDLAQPLMQHSNRDNIVLDW